MSLSMRKARKSRFTEVITGSRNLDSTSASAGTILKITNSADKSWHALIRSSIIYGSDTTTWVSQDCSARCTWYYDYLGTLGRYAILRS